MRARFYAGNDAATIGAWDAARNARPFGTGESFRLTTALESDAAAGHIFLINTHADGGGPAEAYIDEPLPAELAERLTLLPGEYWLELPTGALVVDGTEFYRTSDGTPGLAKPIAQVPPGDYAVRCYVDNADEEIVQRGPESELEDVVGHDELAYYDRTNKLGGLAGGGAPLALFAILWPLIGWKFALTIGAVAFLSFFHVREWVLKRNARYARLRDVVTAYRLGSGEPQIVLELRRVPDRGDLKGGSVSLDDAR